MAKSKKKLVAKKTQSPKIDKKKMGGKKLIGKKSISKTSTTKKIYAKKTAPKKVAAKKVAAKKVSSKTANLQAASKPVPKAVDIAKFVTPLDDRLIVRAATEEKKTAGGLFIPDSAMTSGGNLRGIVLSAGRGHRDKKGRIRPMDVKAGDEILFTSFSGSKLSYEGQEFIILRESDVLGILS